MVDAKDINYAIAWIFNNIKTGDNGTFYIKEYDLYRSPRFRKSKATRKEQVLDKLADLNILSQKVKINSRKPTAIRFVNPAFIERFSAYCMGKLHELKSPYKLAS